MRKNFGVQTWLYPMPVLIIGTYDENGKISVEKLQPVTFDPVHHKYLKLGGIAGTAFKDGLKLK